MCKEQYKEQLRTDVKVWKVKQNMSLIFTPLLCIGNKTVVLK